MAMDAEQLRDELVTLLHAYGKDAIHETMVANEDFSDKVGDMKPEDLVTNADCAKGCIVDFVWCLVGCVYPPKS